MREDKDTPDSGYHEKKEPVIIIHGTSAAAATWWRPGSDFCKKLDAALAKQGSAARCWDGLQEYAEEFKWSGYNSEYHRSLAAMELRRRLDKTARTTNALSVHVVAHSHGGNVTLKALKWNEPSCIKSVVFLGTPLYHYSSMSHSFLWRNVLRGVRNFLPFLILILVMGALFVSVFDMIIRFFDPEFTLFGSLGENERLLYTLVLGLPAISFALIIECWIELNRANKAKRMQQMRFTNVCHIQSKYDEAVGLLKQCPELKKKAPLVSKGNYAPAYFVLTRMKQFQHLLIMNERVRTPGKVVREASVAERAGSLYRRLLWPVSCAVFFILAWIDWIGGKALRFLVSSCRNMAVRWGLNAIGRMALGDDSPTERIISVGPSGEFYKSIRYVDLPDVVEESYAARAKLYHSDIAAAVYRPEANYVQTTQLAWENLVGAVETALTHIELAHCQYYRDDWCIESIAELIAGSSKKREAD